MIGTVARAREEGLRGRTRLLAASPLILLALAITAVCAVLMSGPQMPLGAMYWDLYQFYDGAQRISSGQMPIRDFFVPVGPLDYYLFAAVLAIFPGGPAVLIAQWSMLLVTAPLIALVGWDVAKRSRVLAFALLVPFLFFALLPFNTHEYYPFPVVDGFGTYNRHTCELLYVLVAGLLFVRNRRVLTVVVGVVLPALFFLKMTGFLSGVMLAGYALLTGRLRPRDALAAVAAFAVLLGVLQSTTGVVGDYIADVASLVGLNGALLLPRFAQSASLNFGITAAAGALACVLLWSDRRILRSAAGSAVELRSAARASAVLDHVGLWLLVVLAVGIFNETQNLGSQALIFIWPVCLRIFLRLRRVPRGPVVLVAALALVAATVLPPVLNTFERAGRAIVGSARNVPLQSSNLKQLGAVNMRPEVAARVADMLSFYPSHRATFEDMVAMGDEATPLLYSDVDFQALYLASVDRAVDAIRQLEARSGVRFDTIMALSNYNPFPYLLDRNAPRAVSIAGDPIRTVPTPGVAELSAVADTDLVLYPTCPPTVMSADLLELYADALKNHRRIELSDCYDAFVNPRFRSRLGG
jgi:hypothetical protein